jgi:hypothetical protein
MTNTRNAPLRAGALATALVFTAGFALGTVRVLVLAPALGELAAVAIEMPLILTACWFACAFAARRLAVPPDTASRIAMGATAFALLLAAELVLATLGFGRTLAEVAAAWATPAGALGLAGQIAFAAMPTLQGVRARRA